MLYFLICSVAFFLSLLPWRNVGRSNVDWGLQKFINIDSNNVSQIKKIMKILRYIYICVCVCVYVCVLIFVYELVDIYAADILCKHKSKYVYVYAHV